MKEKRFFRTKICMNLYVPLTAINKKKKKNRNTLSVRGGEREGDQVRLMKLIFL